MPVKNILGLLSDDDRPKKLDKPVVLYFPAKAIGEKDGAHCGKCMMFFEDKEGGKCTVVEGAIDGPQGVCGLYVHGKHMGPTMEGKLDKVIVGYTEDGPTQCGNCEYYVGGPRRGICKKVSGVIEFHGCCNHWESKEELGEHEELETPEEELAEHEEDYEDEE